LARLIHDELEKYGTDGGVELVEGEMRQALLALRAVVDRLGVQNFDPPFRDYSTFRGWWIRQGARGSWQARRDLLVAIFDDLHVRRTPRSARCSQVSTTSSSPGSMR